MVYITDFGEYPNTRYEIHGEHCRCFNGAPKDVLSYQKFVDIAGALEYRAGAEVQTCVDNDPPSDDSLKPYTVCVCEEDYGECYDFHVCHVLAESRAMAAFAYRKLTVLFVFDGHIEESRV